MTVCAICTGSGCYACYYERRTCTCSVTWASPTPRPICPTHGRSIDRLIFSPQSYALVWPAPNDADKWKDETFRNQADGFGWDANGSPVEGAEAIQ